MQAWSDAMMERRFPPGTLGRDQRDWFARTQAAADPEALIAVGELLMRTDLSDDLPRIAAPTLLLVPDGSPFVTVGLSEQIRQRLPDCELAVFPNSRHGLPFSHASACARAVLDFIGRRHDRPPSRCCAPGGDPRPGEAGKPDDGNSYVSSLAT